MRSWSELGQVERIDLYTRASLYVMLWFFVAVFVLAAAPQLADDEAPGPVAALSWAAGLLVVLVAATGALRSVMDLHPAPGPLPWRSIVPLLALCGIALVTALILSGAWAVAIAMPVTATAAWALGGLTHRGATPLLLAGSAVLVGTTTREPDMTIAAVAVAAFVIFTVRVSLWVVGVVRQIDGARSVQAALAVAEERLRFSRDVHDVMGRRLSAIAVQSELAATLAERGDASAGAQMLAVRNLAHETMRETRELARGYRAVDLAQELDGARSLLRSAGIEVDLEVSDMPAPWQEPAAWVVREAVTNVLRHSAATRVSIHYDPPELVVTNDHAVPPTGAGGNGVVGLRERLAPLGATIATQREGDWFTLSARFPQTESDQAESDQAESDQAEEDGAHDG